MSTEKFKSVGEIVTFGTYPQTSEENDHTPIEWLVLDYDETNNKALLLSRYGLEPKSYHSNPSAVTWETCTLRAWLNKDFINKAFSAKEQSAILTTEVDNSSSQSYSEWLAPDENNTRDKVFLLSYLEANKYLDVTLENTNNTKSWVVPTAHASYAMKYWWLRSSGDDPYRKLSVDSDGSLGRYYANANFYCARPAMWIKLP